MIKIREYNITPCMNAPKRYDLSKTVTKTKKSTGEKYEGTNDIGYGMPLESCIENIIFLEVNKGNEITDLKQYIETYKKVKDEIIQIVNV